MTREEAITTLGNFKRYISGGGVTDLKANKAIDMAIEALQTDIVRCGDCKHYSVEGKTTQFGWCNALEMPTDEQRFCADGERREP